MSKQDTRSRRFLFEIQNAHIRKRDKIPEEERVYNNRDFCDYFVREDRLYNLRRHVKDIYLKKEKTKGRKNTNNIQEKENIPTLRILRSRVKKK